MSKRLTRPRPEGRDEGAERPRTIYVRQPVKQLASESGRDQIYRHILVTFSVVLATAVFLAALGAIGTVLGFEPGFALPPRDLTAVGALVDGIAMITSMPDTILRAGEWFVLLPVLGFLWVGIPAAMLTLARPRVPGAPLPSAGSRALSGTGGAVACLVAVASVIWCLLPWRRTVVLAGAAPRATFTEWGHQLDVVGGADVFIFLGLALWCVLGFRLGLPRWGRALTCITLLVAIAVMFTAMASSAGLVGGLHARRPLVEDGSALLMGRSGPRNLLVEVGPEGMSSVLTDHDLRFSGRHASLIEVMSRGSGQVGSPPRP